MGVMANITHAVGDRAVNLLGNSKFFLIVTTEAEFRAY
jgi:hypothetical protein